MQVGQSEYHVGVAAPVECCGGRVKNTAVRVVLIKERSWSIEIWVDLV